MEGKKAMLMRKDKEGDRKVYEGLSHLPGKHVVCSIRKIGPEQYTPNLIDFQDPYNP